MRPHALTAALAVARKDLRVLAAGPAAWVFLAAGAGLCGLMFTQALASTGEASLRPALPNLGVVLLFCVPLLTMRQLAEEDRAGTLELLLTAPIPLGSLVVGKWLATVGLCVGLLAATLPFPVVLWWFGDPDPGALVGAYLGLAACCSVFAAGGLLASSWTRDPTVAAVAGVALLLPSWLASAAADWSPEALRPWLGRLSFVEHLRDPARGVLDTGDLAWFVGATALLLFLTWRSLESRRWR